jgi:hypothetical protein
MSNQTRFPDVFAGAKNGFVTPLFRFVAGGGTKHCRFTEKTRRDSKWFIGRGKI